jgi:hypothetical protein
MAIVSFSGGLKRRGLPSAQRTDQSDSVKSALFHFPVVSNGVACRPRKTMSKR